MTNGRIEVITSVQRRRRWSLAEKQRIVAAAMAPGAISSAVAREAGIHVSQLFRWRQELCKQDDAGAAPSFAAVTISSEAVSPPSPPSGSGAIDIEFVSGVRLRITGVVDAAALSAVVSALIQGERQR